MKLKKPSFKLDVEFFGALQGRLGQVSLRRVGLSIGKEYVDLVEVRRTLRGARVGRFVSVPLRPEGGREGVGEIPEARHERLVEAIHEALRESGIRTRSVVSNLPEEEVIVRYFQMPHLPKKERHQAIRFEARKYIPFTLEDLVSDFFVLEEGRGKERMNVVFVAAKRQAVERHTLLLAKAGLQISHLEVLPFSFLRLLHRLNRIPKEKTIGFVDVDASSSTITLVKQGLPYLVRHVSLESPPEAPEGMETAPPPPSETAAPTPETPSLIQDPLLEKLLDEVRLTLRYYQNQFPAEQVERLLFFGDRIRPGMEEALTKELKLPILIETLTPFAPSQELLPIRLARTVGMGLRGLFPGGADVDLLLPRPGVARENKLVKVCAMGGAAVILCLGALLLFMNAQLSSRETLLETVRSGRRASSYDRFSPQELKAKLEEFKETAALYETILDRRLLWTKKLSELGGALPQGVWVTQLTVTDPFQSSRVMTLRGFAYATDKQEELRLPSQLLENLQRQAGIFEGFEEAKLLSIKRDTWEETPVTAFELTLRKEVIATKGKAKKKGEEL